MASAPVMSRGRAFARKPVGGQQHGELVRRVGARQRLGVLDRARQRAGGRRQPVDHVLVQRVDQRGGRARQRGHLDGGRRVRGRVAHVSGQAVAGDRKTAVAHRVLQVNPPRPASSSWARRRRRRAGRRSPCPRQSPLVAHGDDRRGRCRSGGCRRARSRRTGRWSRTRRGRPGGAAGSTGGRRPGRPTAGPGGRSVSAARTASHFVWPAAVEPRHRAGAVHHDVEVERHLLRLFGVATGRRRRRARPRRSRARDRRRCCPPRCRCCRRPRRRGPPTPDDPAPPPCPPRRRRRRTGVAWWPRRRRAPRPCRPQPDVEDCPIPCCGHEAPPISLCWRPRPGGHHRRILRRGGMLMSSRAGRHRARRSLHRTPGSGARAARGGALSPGQRHADLVHIVDR